jgi:hypothetical protein
MAKLSLYLINEAPLHKDVWGSGGIVPPFLTLALDGGDWWASCPSCFTPGERAPATHWTGHWARLRADQDDLEKRKSLSPTENQTPTLWSSGP